jgi:ATP-dependent DNA helicase DinG
MEGEHLKATRPGGRIATVKEMSSESEVRDALAAVTAGLRHREERPHQQRMAEAVRVAIAERKHLIVQAGTGTGKSLAYLIPAVLSGGKVVVATATKALQDQLAARDLPAVAAGLSRPVTFSVLKGRSNYVCRQRVAELFGGSDATAADQLVLNDNPDQSPAVLGRLGRQIKALAEWAATSPTGDRAELDFEPLPAAWAQVSVGPTDCPGAARCPSGSVCFAEAARQRADAVDVVVVNSHLYATHLAAGGAILPAHDVVIFDEAHEVEDVASSSLGFDVTPGRLIALARTARPLLDETGPAVLVEEAGPALAEALRPYRGQLLATPLDPELTRALTLCRERVAGLTAAVRKVEDDSGRKARAMQAAGHLVADIDLAMTLPTGKVAWVEGPESAPVLEVAPLDVGTDLRSLLWTGEAAPTAVLASATIPPGLGARVGLAAGSFDELDVGSPFDYQHQALLYCPVHLPEPRKPDYEAAMVEELTALVRAAGGRTLALFTSWRVMQLAADAVRGTVPWTVLTQSDLPKPALVAKFSGDETSCLFATMGFWQGVDVPGPSLSLVVIDRLPFPRPDEPLLVARRREAGAAAFEAIDLPRAATLLAQGAGRLVRSASDRGVVAVLDSRLGTARYRWDLVRALPPMRRTRHRADVEAFLGEITGRSPAASASVPERSAP